MTPVGELGIHVAERELERFPQCRQRFFLQSHEFVVAVQPFAFGIALTVLAIRVVRGIVATVSAAIELHVTAHEIPRKGQGANDAFFHL